MGQVTVITGAERRRMWSEEQKQALVEAACIPGAIVTEIARRADVHPSLIYRWRRERSRPVQLEPASAFAPVVVSPDREDREGARPPITSAEVVIETGGTVIRVGGDARPELVSAILRSLRR
jgi:transposase